MWPMARSVHRCASKCTGYTRHGHTGRLCSQLYQLPPPAAYRMQPVPLACVVGCSHADKGLFHGNRKTPWGGCCWCSARRPRSPYRLCAPPSPALKLFFGDVLQATGSPAMWETWFDPWVGEIPWRRTWQPAPAFLPGESHGQMSLAGYSPWGCRESDTTEWLTLSLSSYWSDYRGNKKTQSFHLKSSSRDFRKQLKTTGFPAGLGWSNSLRAFVWNHTITQTVPPSLFQWFLLFIIIPFVLLGFLNWKHNSLVFLLFGVITFKYMKFPLSAVLV